MGNCVCCHAETPCASVEERSGLLDGKTAPTTDTGLEGAFLDSPTSDGRKASMDEIKEGEMKVEQIKAEEKTSVTAQVRQGENTPSMPQENGVVQKENVSMEATAPPPRHQTSAAGTPDPQRQSPPAAEPPGVMGKVVAATAEKQTAEERRHLPSPSQDVPDTRHDITPPAADPVREPAGELRCAQGLNEGPPKSPPPAPWGCPHQEVSNTEADSQPRPLLFLATPSDATTSDEHSEKGTSSPDPQGHTERACSPDHHLPRGPHSAGLPGSLPSGSRESSCPADNSRGEATSMEKAAVDPDHPTELRDLQETLERTLEQDRSIGSRDLDAPHSLLENQGRDQVKETIDAKPEVIRKGRSEEAEEEEEEEEEEAAGQVEVDKGVSLDKPESRVGGEEEEVEPGREPLTAHPPIAAGDDEEEDEKDPDKEEKVREEDEDEEKEEMAEVDLNEECPSDEDLYREEKDVDSSPSSLEVTSMKVDESCSLAPMVDLLSYSQREWRGNTTKSALIRNGYQQMMPWFSGVRRVRGDNYCALRATLFQVLSQATQPPAWLHHDNITMLPEELDGPDGLLSQWSFPGERQSGDGQQDAIQRLKGYVELLRQTWVSAAGCPTADDRRRLCEAVFRGGEDELGLLEALKLLMLGRAAELHRRMERGQEVPVFCWLLFARDTSPCPRTFLTNHLRHVGVSGGLEQVEMFLLGYALRCTIQVYRLYMSGTEEFLTYYPDDHRDDWPAVSLVTEDDRHYNVPVVRATADQEAASR